eukprot:747813-Hanusia_phi.AAC.4
MGAVHFSCEYHATILAAPALYALPQPDLPPLHSLAHRNDLKLIFNVCCGFSKVTDGIYIPSTPLFQSLSGDVTGSDRSNGGGVEKRGELEE